MDGADGGEVSLSPVRVFPALAHRSEDNRSSADRFIEFGAGMKRSFLAMALALGGCATIVEGTTQTITVDVNPPNGVCDVTRQGEYLGRSAPDRRSVTVGKSQYDLEFTCSAPGYITKTETLSSAVAAATVASFFLLDLGIVDAATGAWKKYPPRIGIMLSPER